MQFFSVGRYPNKVPSMTRFATGRPGRAANILERNSQYQEIKPQVHSKFDMSEFKPGKYLNSKKEHLGMTDNLSAALHDC
jgi:hypothetical protein